MASARAHWAFEAKATLFVVMATGLCCTSLVTCRLRAPPPAPPPDRRLAGSKEKLEGLRKKGVVIRPGAGLPALVLANRRPVFPSKDVSGRAPPDARAAEHTRSFI